MFVGFLYPQASLRGAEGSQAILILRIRSVIEITFMCDSLPGEAPTRLASIRPIWEQLQRPQNLSNSLTRR